MSHHAWPQLATPGLLATLGLLALAGSPALASTADALAIERALARVPLHESQPLHVHERRQIVLEVYARLGGEPAWFKDAAPTQAALNAADALARIADRGLDAEDYSGSGWLERLALATGPRSNVDLRATFDVALTRDLAHVACDLLFGRIDPAVVGFEYPWPPDHVDLAGVILAIARTGRAAAELDNLEPGYPAYWRLRVELSRQRELAELWGDSAPINPGDTTLRPGDASPRLPAIARLLASLGDIKPEDEALAAASPYGSALEAGVRRFQERHGLEVDSAIGRETRRELRVPLARRVRQIELTLERWRWIPSRLTEPLVLVNVPAFRLSAFVVEDGVLRKTLETRVIVGSEYPGRHTPLLGSSFSEITFRPSWNAPQRLAREELVPMILRDPARAEREGYVIERGNETLPLDASSAALVRSGTARIRQLPGPDNVLGGARFHFPNAFSVYMHGTSAPHLFEKSNRALSHGCIRVEDPLGLALHLLRGDPSWTRERVEAAMSGSETLHVPLPRGDWALIVYGTASMREDGTMRYFRDVYGLDARLDRALTRGTLD